MNVRSSIHVVSSCLLISAWFAAIAHTQLYNLADDWNTVNNPNGAWALYKSPGVLFDTVQADWFANGTNQPAWADAPATSPFPPNPHVPMWAKAIGDIGTVSGDNYVGFVDAGTVFMHSAESFRTGTDFSSVVWTSPRAGFIEIDGGVWIAKAFDRPHQWELRTNGVPFTGGPLSQGDPYDKTSPFLFAAGTGGAQAVNMAIAQNDTIELVIYRTGGEFVPGTFVATDLRISLVPEPSAFVLLASWTIGALAARRRARHANERRSAWPDHSAIPSP